MGRSVGWSVDQLVGRSDGCIGTKLSARGMQEILNFEVFSVHKNPKIWNIIKHLKDISMCLHCNSSCHGWTNINTWHTSTSNGKDNICYVGHFQRLLCKTFEMHILSANTNMLSWIYIVEMYNDVINSIANVDRNCNVDRAIDNVKTASITNVALGSYQHNNMKRRCGFAHPHVSMSPLE